MAEEGLSLKVEVNKAQQQALVRMVSDIKNGSTELLRLTLIDTVNHARSKSSTEIRGELAIKKKDLDTEYITKKPTKYDLTTKLGMKSRGKLAAFYKFTQLKSGGVSIKIWKTRAPVKLKDAYVINTPLKFTKTPGGTPAFPKAKPEGRKRSDWIYAPSPSQSFKHVINRPKFQTEVAAFMLTRMESKVQFLLDKHK